MKQIPIREVKKNTPAVIAGCMRFAEKSVDEVAQFVDSALELGVDYFDHADIYGNGKCEELFGWY